MGLRAKIAAIFVPLLVLAVLAVSAAEINHTMRVMVDALGESGTVVVNQTYEQIRAALAGSNGDPLTTLRNDKALATFLASSLAFGKGVLYARVETVGGEVVAGTPFAAAEARPPRPFEDLQKASTLWSPVGRIRPLWGDSVYEISSPVEIDHRPFALIKVGLSTALIAAEVHRAVANVLAIAAVVILLTLLGALFAGALLLAPVAAITAGLERLAAGRDSAELSVRGRDELSALAEKFNEASHRVRSDRVQWEDERGRFIGIFRSIEDAVLLLDSEGVVRFANEEAQSRLGLPAGGLAHGKALVAMLGSNHPLVRMSLTAKSASAELRDVAIESGRGRNKARMLVSIFPLGPDMARSGQLVIVRDLAPVQRLENVIDNSGRLARLGELISGVAHQIRNPLNAITLELELLSEDLRNSKPVEDHVQAVREEMNRLDQAIEALMRFMRPEELKTEQVPANDLLGEIARTVNDPMVKVRCDLDPAVPAVNADRAILMEALRNIVQNALEAMPNGGRLTLASALSDGMVELAVSDTGHGIPGDQLDRIFQLYFTTKEDGNGVGLSLALRAVDLHGGSIKIDSKVDEGTTVRIRLPSESQSRRAASEVGA
jgi:signal transduction histidine kinase